MAQVGTGRRFEKEAKKLAKKHKSLDTIVGHSFIPELVAFNLNGDSILKVRIPFMNAGVGQPYQK